MFKSVCQINLMLKCMQQLLKYHYCFDVVRGSLFSEPCRARIVLLDRDQHLLQDVKLN